MTDSRKTDSRSSLERHFDQDAPMDNYELRKLVKILKNERDSMTWNWKASNKEYQRLQKSNERWKFFRSFWPFVTNHDLKEQILMTQKELQASLDTISETLGNVSDQLKKATGEITTEIQTLQEAVKNGPVSDEVSASAGRLAGMIPNLQAAAQALDDLNPDATTPTTTNEGNSATPPQ